MITACHCLLLFASKAYNDELQKMRLVLCVSWRPQGCVLPAEKSDSGYKGNSWSPATMLQQRTTRARSQTGRFFSGPGACAANEKARRLVRSTRQECSRPLQRQVNKRKRNSLPYGCPSIYKSRAGRRADAGTRDCEDRRGDLPRAASSQPGAARPGGCRSQHQGTRARIGGSL